MKDQLKVMINGIVYVPKEPEAEPPKDQPYQMTDADWQRVVDEGFDCLFFDASDRHKAIKKLGNIPEPEGHAYDTTGILWRHCEIRREVGHRQPHFGGLYPGHPDDFVLVKHKDRWCAIRAKARMFDWRESRDTDARITEYIVLEKGGEQLLGRGQ